MNGICIDLNADVGEGMDADAELIETVSSCSVACGGHAGDMLTMRRTLERAKRNGVRAGAHPSYPDREGFGRRSLDLPPAELKAALAQQIETLLEAAVEVDLRLGHVKPHGALYNDAARDPALADLVCETVSRLMPGTALLGLPGSETEKAAARHGLVFLREGFVDRTYEADGSLRSRQEPDALIDDDNQRAEQALALARGAPVPTAAEPVTLRVDTLCIHGDSAGAVRTARHVRQTLEEAGITVAAPGL